MADFAMAHLPNSIDSASQEWADALADTTDAAATIAQRWRQREAIAATRVAPLTQLEHYGITPRQWLEMAREEQSEPLLLLKAK